MPALLGLDLNPWGTRDMDATGNNLFHTKHILKFTAADIYAAGGVSLAAALAIIQAQVPSGALPIDIDIRSNGSYVRGDLSGIGGYYAYDPVANKVSIWVASGTEQGNGAVNAAIISDIPIVEITWRKFGGPGY